MIDTHFLLKQSILKTKEKLLENGAPINTMLTNYAKVIDNIDIYKTSNKININILEHIKEKIRKNEIINTITIVKTDNLSNILIDFIIISIILEISTFFAENNHSVLDVVTYSNGLDENLKFNNNKLFLGDLRNIHIKKQIEQESYLIKLFSFLNKRTKSKMYNIIIIDNNLKETIENNDYISSSIKGTLIIK